MEALMSMVENISVNKAILTIVEGGLSHKSVVVRTHVAMLIDHVITAIGPERFYGSSKDTQVKQQQHFSDQKSIKRRIREATLEET